MNQKQIGEFLKQLRKEKGITQEQLAEELNVSARTVSRWETGRNMPDISLLVEIADFFELSIPEIIHAERKSEIMEDKETIQKMSEYADAERKLLSKRVCILSVVGLVSLLVGLLMESFLPNTTVHVYDLIQGVCFGVSVGALIVSILYSTGILAKVKSKKSKQMKVIAIVFGLICFACFILAIVIS